ncbi:FtsQ-type POTRA domain-containing protein [Radiobacillus kanasensis]|uniref:cell division protein FtsQ/DivIB n=1 Tax=Radiobacillus kanasensis TaxID=2844358 RepID=UPI001E64E852|nr:FtsQ-type POTRA domain-containing protein [Radiobacillus kanasensis]UFU00945.1 FtsQ-type POTRA domain-containing protein [Radiobacillus kanasensis]
MSSKRNVVSIEDRIPKLKQARKKKANRRLIFYLSLFFFLISIIVYLQSPLSHIHSIKVEGNEYLTDEEIVKKSGLKEGDSFWNVNKEKIVDQIVANKVVKVVNVSKQFPTTVTISVEEFQRVGYVKESDAQFFPVLENGERLSVEPLGQIPGDAPLLIGFNKATYLSEMTRELRNSPKSIVDLISEIYWKPTDDNPYKILLYMNDGFVVNGTIRNFSKNMKAYPSIASQIEPGSKGVIHIGVGAFFDPVDGEAAEKKKKEEETTNEAEG